MTHPLVEEFPTAHTPESLVERLRGMPEPLPIARGIAARRESSAREVVLLRSNSFDSPRDRYSFVAANPFLTFCSYGSQCELRRDADVRVHFGNPWQILDALMARFELLDEIDLPFPLGGCFGFWGYDLKNFSEPKLPRRAARDLELPDCHVGFYDSLVVFDHQLGKTFIVSTGLKADGSRSEKRARQQREFWRRQMSGSPDFPADNFPKPETDNSTASNFSRADFISAVCRAQKYIRAGDIYQVNLSQRFTAGSGTPGWEFFHRLSAISPAPYAAFLDFGGYQIVSSSPEQFLRMSGPQIVTRPIKGTRPRDTDATRDAQLAYELQTSPKELAELVMITDLLRNDLGKVCDFGSVRVPELATLEKFAQVHHLVSTVEGRLRKGMTHFAAFASCFPGGSITGAPKFRAMEIIDELEPVSRGPYCGSHGYLGFNRESQLSITIRTAVCAGGKIHYHAGAGIVADSNPEAEYEETLAKARGFLRALKFQQPSTCAGELRHDHISQR